MRAWPILLFLGAGLAGCSGLPPPAALGEASPETFTSWTYAVLDDRGDFYLHLRVAATERSQCSTSIVAAGTSNPNGPNYAVGIITPDGLRLQAGGRGGWGGARHDGQDATQRSERYAAEGGLFDSPGSESFLSPGEEAIVFWAAHGLSNAGSDAVRFRAEVTCDHPVVLLERAMSSAPVLWDDASFTTSVAPANTVAYSAGDLSLGTGGPGSLFFFRHFGATRARLDLEAQGLQEGWDLSGSQERIALRNGLLGDVRLTFEQATTPVDDGLAAPSMVGLFVVPEAVPAFPREHELDALRWDWSLPEDLAGGDVAIEVVVETDGPVSCSFTMVSAGAARVGRHADAWAMWGASGPQELTFLMPVHLAGVQANGQEVATTNGRWTYAREGETRGFNLAAGKTHLAWAFTEVDAASVSFLCDGAYRVTGSRAAPSVAADGYAFTGTAVLGPLYGAAQGAFDVPLAGNVTLLLSLGVAGTVRIIDAEGAFDVDPQAPLEAFELISPVRVEVAGVVSTQGTLLAFSRD